MNAKKLVICMLIVCSVLLAAMLGLLVYLEKTTDKAPEQETIATSESIETESKYETDGSTSISELIATEDVVNTTELESIPVHTEYNHANTENSKVQSDSEKDRIPTDTGSNTATHSSTTGTTIASTETKENNIVPTTEAPTPSTEKIEAPTPTDERDETEATEPKFTENTEIAATKPVGSDEPTETMPTEKQEATVPGKPTENQETTAPVESTENQETTLPNEPTERPAPSNTESTTESNYDVEDWGGGEV